MKYYLLQWRSSEPSRQSSSPSQTHWSVMQFPLMHVNSGHGPTQSMLDKSIMTPDVDLCRMSSILLICCCALFLTSDLISPQTQRRLVESLIKRCLHARTCIAYMYAIPVRSTCCNYVYTCVPVLRKCMRMHIIERGGVVNDDVV